MSSWSGSTVGCSTDGTGPSYLVTYRDPGLASSSSQFILKGFSHTHLQHNRELQEARALDGSLCVEAGTRDGPGCVVGRK